MIIDDRLARKIIQPRPPVSHKGTFGRILLIGGLCPYGGAIIMAAVACVNSGAGLVTVATERENIQALHSHLPEVMAFEAADKALLSRELAKADAVLIGPGLGENRLAQKILDLVLTRIDFQQLLIIDGSALSLIAQQNSVSWPTENLILTPHQKEWERLSGLPVSEQTEEKTKEALAYFPLGTILVAKSHQTKVYDRMGNMAELMAGGPYQATGGMGDTLAGLIAGFAVQFQSASLFECTAAAVYLHSAIADGLSKEAYVVLPSRISAEIPKWMKEFSLDG